ncbi:MAG: TIGR03089 family protein [Actinomycetota bacterium]|nr:TIGR03089 family protein [Actinomycetota bacterium]
MTPERMFADLLAREPGRPFVTYYDESTGERSELSAKSLANWVAKTHHLLTDELGLGVGDTALIALPAHWISVPALLGCLTAGLRLTASQGDDAAVAFVSPDTAAAGVGVADVYAIAPDGAARGFGGGTPGGTEDYVVAVRPQADAWGGVRFRAGEDDPCLGAQSRGDTASRALERANLLGLREGARVLSTTPWIGADSWIDTLLAPLAVGGSVVYIRNCDDEEVLARRTAQERVTNRI